MATACAEARALYSVAQLRAIERAALATLPPFTLMQRAGAAVAAAAARMFSRCDASAPVLVVAGPGNNGGDALEAAAALAAQHIPVRVLMPAGPDRLPADARTALARARAQGVTCITDLQPGQTWAMVVDGLFGIGLARAIAEPFASVVDAINRHCLPVLAIDVPSGLDADTGVIVGGGIAMRARQTLSFIGDKPGLHTGHGRDCAGEVSVDTLGIDAGLFPRSVAELNGPWLFPAAFAARAHASHKGSFGDVTIVGGADGMAGAVILAARTAAMAGAGRVFAAFAGTVPAFDALHPELMCRHAHAVALEGGAAVAGPGLGRSREAVDLVARALGCKLPLVLDADALNILADEAGLRARLAQRPSPVLLTPHPLEAARLLGSDAAGVQADRLAAATALAQAFRATVILKGSGSVIASPEGRCVINTTGNPALATAGSGDVLSGLCGALLARGLAMHDAALAAVWLHGAAADAMVADGMGPVGVTAGELPPRIRQQLNRRD